MNLETDVFKEVPLFLGSCWVLERHVLELNEGLEVKLVPAVLSILDLGYPVDDCEDLTTHLLGCHESLDVGESSN